MLNIWISCGKWQNFSGLDTGQPKWQAQVSKSMEALKYADVKAQKSSAEWRGVGWNCGFTKPISGLCHH